MYETAAPPPGTAFHPGDRVRVAARGVFADLVGRVVDEDPAFPAAVMVRLAAGGREMDVGFHPGRLELARE
jgi:transcription antitermination factor NusG